MKNGIYQVIETGCLFEVYLGAWATDKLLYKYWDTIEHTHKNSSWCQEGVMGISFNGLISIYSICKKEHTK